MKIEDTLGGKFELFREEIGISSMSICSALTLINKTGFSNQHNMGAFFFNLSNGIERLLKVIVLLHKYEINNKFLTTKELKSYGHNIESLFELVQEFKGNKKYNDVDFDVFTEEPYVSIIKVISDFALSDRYHNLNVISGQIGTSKRALSEWDEKINSFIVKKHKRSLKMNLKSFMPLGSVEGSESMHIRHQSYSGENIDNWASYLRQSAVDKTLRKYSTFYVASLTRELARLLSSINQPSYYLTEYYKYFNTSNEYLYRKNWLVY